MRLLAAALVAAGLGFTIARPGAPADLTASALDLANTITPDRQALADRACPVTGPALTGPFAPIDDVISVLPLGSVTAPDEPLPAPHIRINTRKGETVFERRMTDALSPARADVIALERRVIRDGDGIATGLKWKVRFRICNDIVMSYDDIDEIDVSLLRRAGGLSAFQPLDGPDRMGLTTMIRLRAGDPVGRAAGFDVALEDRARAPENLIRPERYRPNPYLEARVRHADPQLVAALTDDPTRAQCPLDYLPTDLAADWSDLLGDRYGMRKARASDARSASSSASSSTTSSTGATALAAGGDARRNGPATTDERISTSPHAESACRTAVIDIPGSAQGIWYTDAAHNALTSRVSAVALAPDAVNPQRQIFSLHGRLASLTPEMIALAPKQREARAEAARDFLTFDQTATGRDDAPARPDAALSAGQTVGLSEDGPIEVGRNTPFAQTTIGGRYCYDGLRANFVGPRINGVLLMALDQASPESTTDGDGATGLTSHDAVLMTLEARSDIQSCTDLEENFKENVNENWHFSGKETVFYR